MERSSHLAESSSKKAGRRADPRRAFLCIEVLALAFLPCAAGARGAAPAWTLRDDARVSGESIYLSDLLPDEISPGLRAAAGRISLGAAPSPGGTLTLDGARIARLLPPAARGELRIPPQVLVHRASRLLTREEVARAIQDSLRYNRLPGATDVQPEDVHFSADVPVSTSDAKLKVRRADFDAALQQDRFLLVSTADRRALPFWVTVARRSAVAENAQALRAPTDSSALESALRDAPSAKDSLGETLVEPRRRAKLHVVSGSMQMFLAVVPLERGALHDTVRVKVAGSGQILRGQVVAPGQLEAKF